ncbi:hypothetical protein BH09BAC1_BH09BAC1_17160 [soil metagenome]
MIDFINIARPEAVGVHVHGKITMDDYNKLTPVLAQKIEEYGKIPVLVKLGDIDTASAKSLYEGAKFDLKHINHFSKVAVVADKQQYEWLVKMAQAFFPGEMRFFHTDDEAAAIAWL